LVPYSLYTFGIALGPVIAAPLSESYGRKIVYSLSLPCFALFILGAALSKSIALLAICQLLAGFSASPGLSVGTGMVADVWPPSSRAIPMAVYLAAPFCGPAFG
jgi:MFS family permease